MIGLKLKGKHGASTPCFLFFSAQKFSNPAILSILIQTKVTEFLPQGAQRITQGSQGVFTRVGWDTVRRACRYFIQHLKLNTKHLGRLRCSTQSMQVLHSTFKT